MKKIGYLGGLALTVGILTVGVEAHPPACCMPEACDISGFGLLGPGCVQLDWLGPMDCEECGGVPFFETECADVVCPGCGNNEREGDEECDGTDDSACPGECQDDCTCSVCGDNEREGGEECDGADDSACPGDCQNDCTCPVCGDDEREGGEECDGTDDSACPGGCQADCTCLEECTLQVDKTCCIPAAPSGDSVCQDAKPITSLILTWDGPDGVDIVTEGGQVINGVNNGDTVVIDSAGLGNDVDVHISGAIDGTSRFHVSCSDQDMNGPEDCGKPQGDGKDNRSERVNLWIFDGFAGNVALNCSADPGTQTETKCTGSSPFDCSDAKPITSLNLIWDGPDGVDIVTEGGQVINGVNNGDTVVIDSAGLGNDVDLNISGAVDGTSRFHVSCSDQEMNGPEDCGKPEGDGKDNRAERVNLWLFAGMAGDAVLDCTPVDPASILQDSCEVTEGGAVEYQYTITNTTSVAVDVTSVFDDQLGELLAPGVIMLDANASITLFETVTLDTTTTNEVTVSADSDAGAECEAMDSVTVTTTVPPFDCSDAKPITSLTMIWDGLDGVDIVTEGGQVITGINNGDEVVIDTAGLGNDVDLTISGAESGNSQFHVSCSDRDMNGPEDCGNLEGNGKKNKADKVNKWIFEGMAGDLALDCTP